MDRYINSNSAVIGVIAPEYQWILITISILVVIAALLFASYIFSMAGKDPLLENTLHEDTTTIFPLHISELKVAPLAARTGEKVIISFTATNLNKSHSHYSVILKIDNRLVNTKEVRIAPVSTLPVQFVIYSPLPGEHRVDVNDVISNFVVI